MGKTKQTFQTLELEVASGLEQIAADELVERYGQRLKALPKVSKGALQVEYRGQLGGLLALNTVNAVYLLETFNIPRPKAFLGHEHFTRLLTQIETARQVAGHKAYRTLYLNAAGSQTAVMQRIAAELGKHTRLTLADAEGDLLVRLRRSTTLENGWDALVRLSPRPNATRAWRVENAPGALNGAVARAMVLLSEPTDDDVVLNVACGTGSLAIERALHSNAKQILGCDNDLDMLEKAFANVAAAKLDERVSLHAWDATDLPLGSGSVDVLLADLPFGNLIGSHKDNERLYPAILSEAARVCKKEGRFVLITHEVKLTDWTLKQLKKWAVLRVLPITLSGLHPRIYVLKRI